MTVRLGPSGKIVTPTPGDGTANWNGLAPLVIEMLPAGHTPGLWSFSIAIVQLVVASAGTFSIVLTWDQPFVGPVSHTFNAAVSMTAAPGGFIAPRHVMSSGLAPLVMTLTPAGVTGAPSLYVNLPVDDTLALFPEGF